jgi:HPt (histidine-containing phosphotransfer) domain-containing protein
MQLFKEKKMIDKKQALDDFQITEEMYDEMLVEFVAQAEEKVCFIEEELQKKNTKEAEQHTHSLKGVAGNLRLNRCFMIASAIDKVLKSDSSPSLAAEILDLKNAIDEVRNSIKK